MLDSADAGLTGLFDRDDLLTLQKLEETLVSTETDATAEQRVTFSAAFYDPFELQELQGSFWSVEVCGLFGQVETLVRLLLVIPVLSSEAEQSFSVLRRLKTWLRSTRT